ncbi:type 4 pilus major pilin [Burkholderia sp. BCC0044]|uniref:type 4 pilus major pilin n=1 Tax=Burkholderia sp. BCC0044 TaxID=2676295 RepID=UPI0015887454|nr:type 4 pilus major pilin [Burkholderia sp. BCC0044]
MIRNKSVPRLDNQRGFTLIETLVVMIVGIVMLAAAAAGIGKLFRASEITEEASNIMHMRAQLDELNKQNHFKGITNDLAIKFNIVPANMAVQGSNISNVWGGMVRFGAPTNGKRVSIDYFGVPADACQQLVLKIGNAGWDHVNINDNLLSWPLTLMNVGAECKDGNGNKLTFVPR